MERKNTKILVVDDDKRLREMIRMVLENRDFQVMEAVNGEEAILKTRMMEPDLILMDVMMPTMDGFTACSKIREFTECPIIMLTAKGEDYDQVNGLDRGADDYIIKPFTPMVLIARIESVLRRFQSRTQANKDDKLEYGNLIINILGRMVMVDGVEVEFSKKEFDLLVYLVQNYDISLSRDQILEQVWGYDFLGSESTVDSHINRLRNKLSACGSYIKTIRGYGYKFEVSYEN